MTQGITIDCLLAGACCGKWAIITLVADFVILLALMRLTTLCRTCWKALKTKHAACVS